MWQGHFNAPRREVETGPGCLLLLMLPLRRSLDTFKALTEGHHLLTFKAQNQKTPCAAMHSDAGMERLMCD